MLDINRQLVLASRPVGEPTKEDFRLRIGTIPKPGSNQMLVKNLFLSIDPYMRGRMSDRANYAQPVAIDEVMIGGTVARVVASDISKYAVGSLVVGYGGWQDYAIFDARDRQVIPVSPDVPPSTALGVAGMPGATAYFGLTKLGLPRPGETVVVSAASGAVGSVAGQLAKLWGCRAVGIAGGPRKCEYVVETLGFDACVNHRSPTMADDLVAACPQGIDIYFENVGGKVLDAVVKHLNRGARVPVCGYVSQYNEPNPVSPLTVLSALPEPPAHRFFVVWDWPEEYPTVIAQLTGLVRTGKLRYREDVVVGLENAPTALIELLRGDNFGKKLVQL